MTRSRAILWNMAASLLAAVPLGLALHTELTEAAPENLVDPLLLTIGGMVLGLVAALPLELTAFLPGSRPWRTIIGSGPILRQWVTRRGQLVELRRWPSELHSAWSPGTGRRLHIAVLITAAVVGTWAVLFSLLPMSSLGYIAVAWGVFVATFETMIPILPPGRWGAVLPTNPDCPPLIDAIWRAHRLRDRAEILRLTASENSADHRFVAAKAWALGQAGRHSEAVEYAWRAAGDDRHGHETVSLWGYDVPLLVHQAMEAGGPGSPPRALVRMFTEIPRLSTRLRHLQYEVLAIDALLTLDYELAVELARRAMSVTPRPARAPVLCTLARGYAGLGDYALAHQALNRARSVDPAEIRIRYAENAIATTESRDDLTAASY